jgi:hypothetical protein
MPPEATAAAVAVAEGWKPLKLDVSKKVSIGPDKNEYQKVGEVTVPVPTLEAFGIKAETRPWNEETDGEDDGLPKYKEQNIDWLFGAVVAACKMQARNKLISGTAELKEGQKIAATFEELTAEGERRGNAEALKLAKEAVSSFVSFVQGLGKTAQTQAMLIGLFRNRSALSLQPDTAKEKFKGYLTSYAETLSEEDLGRYQKILTAIEEACAPGAPTDF